MATGKKGEKTLSFGARLKYPIRITRLYKSPGDAIRRQEPVLQYAFEYTMDLPQDRSTLALQTKTLTSITDWNAPEDGTLLAWRVRVGDVVARDGPCATVEEACTHEVQFQGLCALCGQDMNEVNWASEQRGTDRAPINMTHDQTSLTVSHSAAARAENELQARLLAQRKLSLVVDLDQTIIHACFDPTIGEWQQDPANPNYAALRDVRRFQLESPAATLGGGATTRNWYYIKMRPGLKTFLEAISQLYELHVYTMGTRSYATNIARIVDPDQRLFGNRVISRDENGNIVAKSLQRLFPVSTHMAVIIDDRADVWPYNRHNLIKVTPYDFFKGTGDINSSFLPKRSDLGGPAVAPAVDELSATTPTAAVAAVAEAAAAAAADAPLPTVVADGPLAATGPGAVVDEADNPATPTAEELAMLQRQAEEQERAIAQQIQERPLLHMQQKLDEADQAAVGEGQAAAVAAASAAAAATTATTAATATTASPSFAMTTTPPPVQQHAVLLDDDDELRHLQVHLTTLHRRFYEAYDAAQTVPDVSTILDGIKGDVLKNTVIVLSGLVPLGLAVEQSEIGLQALSFGARLHHHVSRATTHLVISSDRPRTQKVRQAARFPGIHIVRQDWLAACFAQWAQVDEEPYRVPVHPADRGGARRPRPLPGQPAETETTAGATALAGDDDGTDTDTLSDADSETVAVANGEDGEGGEDGENNDAEDGNGNAFGDFQNGDSTSPIAELGAFDWSAADDELEMFLAEDDEDEEGEEGGDGDDDEEGDSRLAASSKRKYDGDANGDGDEPTAAARGNGLLAAKRQRRGATRSAASSRSGSRTRMPAETATAATSSAPNSKPGGGDGVDENKNNDADDDDDDELEAMLMAELDEEDAEAEAAAAAAAASDNGQKEGHDTEDG